MNLKERNGFGSASRLCIQETNSWLLLDSSMDLEA